MLNSSMTMPPLHCALSIAQKYLLLNLRDDEEDIFVYQGGTSSDQYFQ